LLCIIHENGEKTCLHFFLANYTSFHLFQGTILPMENNYIYNDVRDVIRLVFPLCSILEKSHVSKSFLFISLRASSSLYIFGNVFSPAKALFSDGAPCLELHYMTIIFAVIAIVFFWCRVWANFIIVPCFVLS
jgi:hypothetical protein